MESLPVPWLSPTPDLSRYFGLGGGRLFGEERWLQGAIGYWSVFGSLRCIFIIFKWPIFFISKSFEGVWVHKKCQSIHKWVFCVVVNKKGSLETLFLILLGQEASPDPYGEGWEGNGKFNGMYGAVWTWVFLQSKKI